MKKPPTLSQIEQDMRALGMDPDNKPERANDKILRILFETCSKTKAPMQLRAIRDACGLRMSVVGKVLDRLMETGAVHKVSYGFYIPANVEQLRKRFGGGK